LQGIRGAITVEKNTEEDIFISVQQMVREMCIQNDITPENIGAAIFSATGDLTAAFPAAGARRLLGFELVPLFDARQMDVDNSLQKCIRVLLLVNTDKSQQEIHHVYLNGAAVLRPDLIK
jgi:chorismate mutase